MVLGTACCLVSMLYLVRKIFRPHLTLVSSKKLMPLAIAVQGIIILITATILYNIVNTLSTRPPLHVGLTVSLCA